MSDEKRSPCAETARVAEDDYGDGWEPNCQTCGGEGIAECEDSNSSEGCWEPRCDGYFHRCPNCRGSGLAKDQWYW